jgi:hypothetical protein
MRIEHLRLARRVEEDWDPFMQGIRRRIRRRRRERLLSWGAVAALVVAVLGGLWFLPGPGESLPTFRAQVPTMSEPLFTPSSGTAVAVSAGAVVILPEVHT